MDFEANAKDGVAVDWPIRYRDVAPWYDHVERFIGVSGQAEGLAQLPDGQFLPPMEMNCVEKHLKRAIADKFGRPMTIGRVAHLTAPLAHSPQRGTCQSRNLCIRGCPYGAYFSSNSSTLPAAEKTGNMTLRPNSIVYELIYDEKKRRASGVRVLDAETNEHLEFHARVIFLCASTFGSTFIMMNSISSRFPHGFGNDSGELGCNIMDHHLNVGALARSWKDSTISYYAGDGPNGIYVPRFVNIGKDKRDYLRGFGYQGGASRLGWTRLMTDTTLGRGAEDRRRRRPGPGSCARRLRRDPAVSRQSRHARSHAQGQARPAACSRSTPRSARTSARCASTWRPKRPRCSRPRATRTCARIDRGYGFGLGIHEMGTARMGRDPKTSVLNEWNQVHACKNVYVTDGSCMTSAACQNPSLTYMALTARAANHAVEELKRHEHLKLNGLRPVSHTEPSRIIQARRLSDGRRDFRAGDPGCAQRLRAEVDHRMEAGVSHAGAGQSRGGDRRDHHPAHRHAGRQGCRRAGLHRYDAQGCLIRAPITSAILSGLNEFEAQAQREHRRRFMDLGAEARLALVQGVHDEAIESRTRAPRRDAAAKRPFILMTKELTLLGFFTSQAGATQVLQYDPVPGAYHGCVPLAQPAMAKSGRSTGRPDLTAVNT